MLDMAIFVPALRGSSLCRVSLAAGIEGLSLYCRIWNVPSHRPQAHRSTAFAWDPISLWPQLAKVRNVMSTYSWWCQESFGFAASASLHSKCRRWLIWLELGISGRGRPHIMTYTMFIIVHFSYTYHYYQWGLRCKFSDLAVEAGCSDLSFTGLCNELSTSKPEMVSLGCP